MTTRPMTVAELAYLKRFKGTLDASLQALWITLGLVALPVAFLASALRTSQDRLAMGLAGAIMILLMAAVVFYSAKSHQERKLGLAEAALFKGLVADMAEQKASIESVTLTGKETRRRKGAREDMADFDGGRDSSREYWLLAGDKRFQVGPGAYMAAEALQVMTIEYATHSRLVLTIDGQRERLPLQAAPGRNEPIEVG